MLNKRKFVWSDDSPAAMNNRPRFAWPKRQRSAMNRPAESLTVLTLLVDHFPTINQTKPADERVIWHQSRQHHQYFNPKTLHLPTPNQTSEGPCKFQRTNISWTGMELATSQEC